MSGSDYSKYSMAELDQIVRDNRYIYTHEEQQAALTELRSREKKLFEVRYLSVGHGTIYNYASSL